MEIKDIKDPKFLRSLNYDELNNIAKLLREHIIDVASKKGGHLSSNLGVVELTMALHRNFDFSKDKLLFDVGHQCYAHKILTGRDITSLRDKGGISGFIKTNESSYDIFESGHSSTSLSAAYAFALDRDNKGEHHHVVCFIGDASIANGVAFEALNNIAKKGHKIIIILNDNNMAISAPVGRLSNVFRSLQTSNSYFQFKRGIKKIFGLIKPIYKLAFRLKNWFKKRLINPNIFDILGYNYIGVNDGHDFKALDKALERAKRTHNCVVVHVKTKKGKGYKYAENDSSGYWHGVNPFDKKTGKLLGDNKATWSDFYSNLVMDKLKSDPKFYLICPGTLVGSSLSQALFKFPNRVIDVGIAEEHAVVLASYLAKLGYHVCVSIYSTFMQRAIDQISHDLARINSSVTFLVDRSGLVGRDGDTHQGLYDEAYLVATPNVRIAMASDSNEARQLFYDSFLQAEATFIRFPRESVNINDIADNSKVKNFTLLNDKKASIALVGVGPLIRALASELKDSSIDIYNLIYLKPIAKEFVTQLLKYRKIIIYSPYETRYGFSSLLIHELVSLDFKGTILTKAVPNQFVKQATIEEQLEDFGLTVKQMKQFILGNL